MARIAQPGCENTTFLLPTKDARLQATRNECDTFRIAVTAPLPGRNERTGRAMEYGAEQRTLGKNAREKTSERNGVWGESTLLSMGVIDIAGDDWKDDWEIYVFDIN